MDEFYDYKIKTNRFKLKKYLLYFMNVKERFDLVKRGTIEIITESELEKLLEEKKHPSAYWGTATTGKVHIAYFIPILKIANFLKAGFKFKILIANLHAHLDDQKSPWSLLNARSVYYQEIIQAMLDALKVDTTRLMFVRGSDFQTKKDYVLDVLRMSALTTLARTRRAAAEVVRFGKDPKMGGFFYPLMQTEDIPALEADVAYSGGDQRGIYAYSRELLPQIGHDKPVCVFTPMLPGLGGGKMSSSDEKSKIDLIDSKKDVEKKINSAFCVAGSLKDNGVMAFVEYFLFPFNEKLKIERSKKFGGDKEYEEFSELKKDFVAKKLHPADLKKSVALELNKVLNPVRKRFDNRKGLLKEAYP